MTERIDHTATYMKQLKTWRMEMASFLDQANSNTAPLVLIFQRQKNVLNLAYWHTVILTNRPLLLSNFSRLTNSTRSGQPGEDERRAHINESVSECLNAALEIVGIVDMMTKTKQLLRAFWVCGFSTENVSRILLMFAHSLPLILLSLRRSSCMSTPYSTARSRRKFTGHISPPLSAVSSRL